MIEDLGISSENLTVSGSLLNLLVSTAVLIITVIIFRLLITRYIRKSVTSTELRRRWLVQSRNGLVLLLLMGLVFIWGEELRTLALSLVAIAIALVVATKELILCITGSLLKAVSSSFDLGDRIQIKDFRGGCDRSEYACHHYPGGGSRQDHSPANRADDRYSQRFVCFRARHQ